MRDIYVLDLHTHTYASGHAYNTMNEMVLAAKEKGLVGLEGKDYVVKDGDVILFRFNV